MKRILYFGSGIWQKQIIEKLNKTYSLTVVTPDAPDWLQKMHCDLIVADLRDSTSIEKEIYGRSFEGVLCDSAESGVVSAAKIAELLNLPGISSQVALNFTDKSMMRRLTSEIFKGTSFHLSDFENFEPFGKKYLVKPRNSQGSLGVKIFSSKYELLQILSSYEYSFDDTIIESYLEGTEHTIEALVISGRAYPIAISSKIKLTTSPTIAHTLSYTAYDETRPLHLNLANKNQEVISTLGLENGITHGEYMVDQEEISLVEIAARGGGSGIYTDILPQLSGCNLFEEMARFAIGEGLQKPSLTRQKFSNAVLAFFNLNLGKYMGVCHEHTKSIPPHEKLYVEAREGQQIKQPTSDRERHGFVILYGFSEALVFERLAEIQENGLCFLIDGLHSKPKFVFLNDY